MSAVGTKRPSVAVKRQQRECSLLREVLQDVEYFRTTVPVDAVSSYARATVLLKTVRTITAPNGSFFFTNIARHNPCRPWMEYATNWRLIERSPHDIQRLVSAVTDLDEPLDIAFDPTGLAMLVRVSF